MTEFEIHRTAKAVVDLLLSDDRFISRMAKVAPKGRLNLLNSHQAASMLGISAYTIRQIAPYIGGIKSGDGKRAKWTFEEQGLKERYIQYVNSK